MWGDGPLSPLRPPGTERILRPRAWEHLLLAMQPGRGSTVTVFRQYWAWGAIMMAGCGPVHLPPTEEKDVQAQDWVTTLPLAS